jgi:hypothetical protein
METSEKPKPHLARIFEAVAAIMGLGEGLTELHLIFDDGQLQRFHVHVRGKVVDLSDFDEQAAWLVCRTGHDV